MLWDLLALKSAFFPCPANNHGVDVAKILLDGGADLNARTVWGDTAAHYCGRWGPHELLQFLLDKGIEVHKSKGEKKREVYVLRR